MVNSLMFSALAGALSLVSLIVAWARPEALRALPAVPTELVSLFLYICYIYGFVVLAKRYARKRLEYAAYTWIAATLAMALLSFVPEQTSLDFLSTILLLITAGAMIIVGWTMVTMADELGTVARVYGIFAMLSGAIGLAFSLGSPVSYTIDALTYASGIALFYRAAKK